MYRCTSSPGKNLLGRAMPSVSAFYRAFLEGKSLTGSWAANAADYWAQRHRPNVLVVSFATMKQDLEATVRRVAEFLDIQVSDDVLREVCRKSSFDYMKSIDERFATYRGAPWRNKTFMLRCGKQGGRRFLLHPSSNAKWTLFSSTSCRDSDPIFLTTKFVEPQRQNNRFAPGRGRWDCGGMREPLDRFLVLLLRGVKRRSLAGVILFAAAMFGQTGFEVVSIKPSDPLF